MKIFLALALLAALAAGAYALDLGGFFSGDKAAAAPAPAPAAPAVPVIAEEPKPGNCDFPLNIKPQEARFFIESRKPAVVDIRTADEYAAGHLAYAGAPLDYYAPDFKERLGQLDKSAAYLIYCRSGRRSAAALQVMKDLGFTDIHDLDGGIVAWQASGLPVTK